ncbi:S-adenosylmethionine decarboxylase [Candidatus Gottesmanbacteria bacterium]|nr:S-adenosylmethionine decarboxylase [Candidatus Gottesmanbacteria bacterium]
MLNYKNPHEKDAYGQELVINLYGCSLRKISSQRAIRTFVITLCDEVIHMKRYGEPLIPHFGHDNPITLGYSVVQLIETSSVTGHFSEYKKSAYINIFSCAWYDMEATAQFCQEFFEAKRIDVTLLKRP